MVYIIYYNGLYVMLYGLLTRELWLLGAFITGALPVAVFPIMFPGVQWYHALIAVLAGEEEGRN